MSARTASARGRPFPAIPLGVGLCLTFVAVLLSIAVLSPLITPYDPNLQRILERLQPPSWLHWLGTDELGRDVLSRLMAGTIVSVVAGIGSTVIGATTGTLYGLLAGYLGGWPDDILMRLVDVLIAFPAVVFALAIVAVAGSSLTNVLLVLGVIQIPIFARVARSMVLIQVDSEYIAALRSVGVTSRRILLAHILPNSLSPLTATAGLMVAGAVLNEAALSFLGLGVAPPTATWGNMLASGRTSVLLGTWWLTVFPGLALFLTVLVLNVLADDVRDLLDPRRVAR